jgi:predicted nucleic acid-binding protein
MEKEIVLLDTSILIEYFRKTDKSNSYLYKLSESDQYKFAVSSITKFEIYVGSNEKQNKFWDSFFESLTILPFDGDTALFAVDLNSELKRKRKQIAIPDLFIAATAVQANLKIATHNRKHFERISALELI